MHRNPKHPDISVDATHVAFFIHYLNQVNKSFRWTTVAPPLEAMSNHLAKKYEIKLLSIM